MRNLMQRTGWALLAVGGLSVVICGMAQASPTGLNNIPTVDVAPRNVLVLQTWANIANDAKPAYVAGLKYGLLTDVEIGLDSRIDSGDSGPLTAQAKWRLPLPAETCPFALLVGVANLSDDRDDAGETDPYLVSGCNLGPVRLSLGYSFQNDNNSLFAGVDKLISFQSRDLILRADVRQIHDGEEWLASGGLLHELPLNLIVEGWVSASTADGTDEVYTLKMNWVVPF